MAKFNIDNWDDVPDRGEYQPIPAGDYLVEVTSGEVKENHEEGSSTVQFVYTIIDGPFSGRQLRSNHAVEHPIEQRLEIGLITLKQMSRAVDLLNPSGETDEYIGRQCNVRVSCDPGKDGKTYSNIKTWWSLSSQAPPVRQSTVRTVAPQVSQQPQPPRQQAPGQPQMWQPGQRPQPPRAPQRQSNGSQQQGDDVPF